MYKNKHKTLFTSDNKPHKGNALASAFWFGYDGCVGVGLSNYINKKDRNSASYIFFKAGQNIKKQENNNGKNFEKLYR